MVLAELGGRITAAMRNMTAHTVIDEEAVDVMLKEIASVRPPPNPRDGSVVARPAEELLAKLGAVRG